VSGAPDFATAVAGYRAWQLGPGGVLFPLVLPAAPPWEPGVNGASCFAGRFRHAHEAPGPECMCGFYALHRHDDARLRLGHPAVGAIAAWGEIVVYRGGFRAEFACVIALAHPVSRSSSTVGLHDAARRYGVRLVSLAELEDEARQFALPLPEEALPSPHAAPSVARAAGARAARTV
jgi:hypothetical protein